MLLGEDRRALRKEHEFETSIKAENTYRNRYVNILSNEPTRVKLEDVAPGESDYINANHITGHGSHPGYIATQAPLPETMAHFWQMVYETVAPVIIMLTREQEEHCAVTKSERYWPANGENVLFDSYLVHGLDERKSAGVIERRFQVARVVDSRKKHAKDLVDADSLLPPVSEGTVWHTPARRRAHNNCDDPDFDCEDDEELMRHLEAIGSVVEVVQLQYIDWPDQEVPEDPETLLDLVGRVDEISKAHYVRSGMCAQPIVHCSAGVGRTGTFIAVDRTLRRLWDAFDRPSGANRQAVCVEEIRELVRAMKNERSKMVQTPEQYRFIYESVLAGLKRWEEGQVLFQDRTAGPVPGASANGSVRHMQDEPARSTNGQLARLQVQDGPSTRNGSTSTPVSRIRAEPSG